MLVAVTVGGFLSVFSQLTHEHQKCLCNAPFEEPLESSASVCITPCESQIGFALIEPEPFRCQWRMLSRARRKQFIGLETITQTIMQRDQWSLIGFCLCKPSTCKGLARSSRARSDGCVYIPNIDRDRWMSCLRGMSDTNVNSNLSANIILAVKHGASCSISIMCFDNEIKQLEIARDIVG